MSRYQFGENMAETRRLAEQELILLNKVDTIAYNQRRDYSKEENQKTDPLDHPANWAWGVFENSKLLAGMYEIEFLMRFDGHDVKMSGIGGVATLPEARNGGNIRRIFDKLLPQAFENGVVFSSLNPFSHDFYRKFGYEIAGTRNNITIPTGDLSEIKAKGRFVHILPGDDTSLLARVHSEYIANINHGIHRDYWPENRAWKRFTREDPYTSGVYLYLWKDENDVPRGYIQYKDIMEDGDHNMSVTELAFTDKKGLYGALSITGGLSAQFENFKWLMPSFLDPSDFAGDAWSIEQSIRPRDMTRVVNVKAALELMRHPEDEGEYVIEVKDENITANSGKYLVQFGTQGAKVSAAKREADITCDIQTLSQLVMGYRSLENALYSRLEGLEVHGKMEVLKRVFTERPQHLTEYF
jgi:predicted acetyltransferase